MKCSGPELIQCHLKPGELVICRDARIVTTVLGSCVSVTMFNARFGLAAICHAMLPEPRHALPMDQDHPERFRYLSFAIPAMMEAFRRAGLTPAEIDVKLFGGASVMHTRESIHAPPWVGQGNVSKARQLLREANLHPKAANVGGHGGRKILFNTATGGVLHKHLS